MNQEVSGSIPGQGNILFVFPSSFPLDNITLVRMPKTKNCQLVAAVGWSGDGGDRLSIEITDLLSWGIRLMERNRPVDYQKIIGIYT